MDTSYKNPNFSGITTNGQYGSNFNNAAPPLNTGISVTPTVNADSLNGQKNFVIPPTQPDPNNYSSIISGLTTSLGLATNEASQIEKKQNENTSELERRLEELKGKSAYTQEQENAQGIPQLQNDIQELTDEINAIGAETAAGKIALEGQGRGIPQEILNRQGTKLERDNTIRGLLAEVKLRAKQGKLSLAEKSAQRAVDLKFAPIEQEIKSRLDFYERNKETLTGAKKKQADAEAQILQLQLKQVEDQKTQQGEIQKLVIQAAQNGANNVTLSRMAAASDPISAAQTGSGFIGTQTASAIQEYQFAKRNGYAGSFTDYQNEDANRKKAIAAAGVNGLSQASLGKVLQISGQYDNEPSVRSYQTVAEGKAFMDSIPNNTQNPADQQGIIYAFAKIMDPNSVVREGEYATVQKYAQSWAQTFGFNAERIFSNSPFLSEQAIKNMKATISKKVAASEGAYKNIYNDYSRRINKVTGGGDGADYITDYSKGYSSPSGGPSTPASAGSGSSNNPLGI